MEWPPRKFHPNRLLGNAKFPNRAHYENARRNGMLRELKGLEIKTYTQQELNVADQNHDPGIPGGYIEEYPPEKSRWRRQNMVHFDIDPQNSTFTTLALQWNLTRNPPSFDRCFRAR